MDLCLTERLFCIQVLPVNVTTIGDRSTAIQITTTVVYVLDKWFVAVRTQVKSVHVTVIRIQHSKLFPEQHNLIGPPIQTATLLVILEGWTLKAITTALQRAGV